MFTKDTLIVDDILRVYGNSNKKFRELFAKKIEIFGIEKVNDNMCYFDELVFEKVKYEKEKEPLEISMAYKPSNHFSNGMKKLKVCKYTGSRLKRTCSD